MSDIGVYKDVCAGEGKVTGGWTKVCNFNIHGVDASPDFIRVPDQEK